MTRATLPAVDPKRLSVPEADTYRMLWEAVKDLRTAERALTLLEQAAPDVERAAHLHVLRSAIEQLGRVVAGSRTDGPEAWPWREADCPTLILSRRMDI